MLTSNRVPCDHLLSTGLNNFYITQDLKGSLKAGAISYFAIKASNEIAKKDYKNAVISGISGILINQFLGEKQMANNNNPYLNNNYNNQWNNNQWNNNQSYGYNQNCPFNPYLNNNFNNTNNTNQGFLSSLTSQGNGLFGSPLVKGILIGAAVTYLLSNKDAKDTLAKGVAKIQSFASAAIEEFKEQVEDAKASMQE